MHGQRSSATRVDDHGEVRTPPPRPLRGHPSSSEEGKPRYSARRPTTLLAPPPPRPLRGHPSSSEEGKSLEPQHHESPSAAFCLAISSAIPRFASASSASICAAEK